MGITILLGMMVLFTIAFLVTGMRMRKRTDSRQVPTKNITLIAGAVMAVITAVAFILSIFITVDPRHVGVVTSFGKPTDTLDNGLHVVAPWSDVTQFDGTIQSMTLVDRGDDGAVVVRLKDGGTAWVNLNLQWRINSDDKEGVKKLFGDYRDPVRVDELFVERQVRASVYAAFGTFDPTAGIIDSSTPTPVATFATHALNSLQKSIGTKGISLVSLTISDIAYDKATEAKIARMRALAADKRAAELQVEINKKIAEANNQLSAGAKDKGTLYQLCLATTEKLVEAGKTLSPAWNCDGASAQTVVPVR